MKLITLIFITAILISFTTDCHPPSSIYWKYVVKNVNGMRCNIGTCTQIFKNHHAGAIKNHISRVHPEIFAEIEIQQKSKTQKRKLNDINEPSDPKKAQDHRIAILLSKPTIPISLFEDEKFKNFLDHYDHRYKIPKSRTASMSILNQEHTRLMESVKELLKNSLSKKSIVLDIWTTPGMKESYIGGNAYFVDADFKIRKLFLGLVEMPVGHNAIVVREHAGKLLTNLGIQESDVFVVITDNASNFKRAYSEALNEKNLVDAESDELDEDHENNEEVEEVESNDEDDEVESNDEDEINDDEVQNELQEVEALETEYNGIYPTRLSCAAHDLSLVMSTVFEKKSILSSSIIKMTKKLISRFKKSHAATKSLAIKTKEVLSKSLVLLLPGPTRWAGHFYMINRLLKIVNPINEIALTKGWEILEERHLKVLRGLHALMKPVADLLLQSQSEEMGISKLYFALMEMIDTLENLELEDLTLTSTKSDLQAEIKRRFARILDPDSNEFNSLYIKASILDPQEFLTLEEEKYSIDDYLREMIKESMRLECEKNPSQASDTSNTQDQSSQKSYKDRLIAKRRENLSRCNQNANQEEPIQAIIKEYKRMMESPHVQNLTPLEFWQQHGNGILAPLKQNALDLLPVPMTGASIERVFSSASLATKGIKNRSSSNLLRKKLFIHLNN